MGCTAGAADRHGGAGEAQRSAEKRDWWSGQQEETESTTANGTSDGRRSDTHAGARTSTPRTHSEEKIAIEFSMALA